MLQKIDCERGGTRLDLSAWHKPLVSIIITHFNYSEFVRDAILSVLDQTYENWELVVVDDGSSPEHLDRLKAVMSECSDRRIRLHAIDNVGQVRAFFAGLDLTHGEFVCPLDPDDRYAPTYLEETVAAHLNDTVICPIATTDQYLVRRGEVIGGCWMRHKQQRMLPTERGFSVDHGTAQLIYFPKHEPGWHWASTSGLMVRRSALNLIRPTGPLNFDRALDCYLAFGLHALGGSLVLTKPLVYRSLHDRNSWIRQDIYATSQKQWREDAIPRADIIKQDVAAALTQNGAEPAAKLLMKAPELEPKRKRGTFARWTRSFRKRWPF